MLDNVPDSSGNWALALAEGMEKADIDWIDDPDSSINSRQRFNDHLREKWGHIQNTDSEDA